MSNEFYDKLIRDKKAVGIKLGYFMNEFHVYCPYCGHKQDQCDMWEDLPREHEVWEKFKCYSCRKYFRVQTNVLFSTEKSKEPDSDGEEEDGD